MADFIVASERACFCLAFACMGLVPDLGALHVLPRIIGVQRRRELVYSARELPASEAQALGLVLDVLPAQALPARAHELAEAGAQAIALTSPYLRDAAARFSRKEPLAFRWPPAERQG